MRNEKRRSQNAPTATHRQRRPWQCRESHCDNCDNRLQRDLKRQSDNGRNEITSLIHKQNHICFSYSVLDFFFDIIAPQIAYEYIRCFVLDRTERQLNACIKKQFPQESWRIKLVVTSHNATEVAEVDLADQQKLPKKKKLISEDLGLGTLDPVFTFLVTREEIATPPSAYHHCPDQNFIYKHEKRQDLVSYSSSSGAFSKGVIINSGALTRELPLSVVGELLFVLDSIKKETFFFPEVLAEAMVSQASLDTIFQRFSASQSAEPFDYESVFGGTC